MNPDIGGIRIASSQQGRDLGVKLPQPNIQIKLSPKIPTIELNNPPPRYSTLSNIDLPGTRSIGVQAPLGTQTRGSQTFPRSVAKLSDLPGFQVDTVGPTSPTQHLRLPSQEVKFPSFVGTQSKSPHPTAPSGEIVQTGVHSHARPGILTIGSPQPFLPSELDVEPITGRWNFVWIALIGILFIALIAFFIVIFFRDTSPDLSEPIVPEQPLLPIVPIPVPPDKDPVTTMLGETDNGCFEFENATFFTDQAACRNNACAKLTHQSTQTGARCECLKPFYGEKCDLESFSDKYLAIGQFDPKTNKSEVEIFKEILVDRLSFPKDLSEIQNSPQPEETVDGTASKQSICTNMCDCDHKCIGVIFDPNPDFDPNDDCDHEFICKLLKGKVKMTENIPYDTLVQPNLFLKDFAEDIPRLPFIKDRVFLIKGEEPLRFWLNDNYKDDNGNTRSLAVFEQRQQKLDFVPEKLSDDGTGLTGIFSPCKIPEQNSVLKGIIMGGSNRDYLIVPPVKHNNTGKPIPDRPLNFPSDWAEIYTIFVDFKSLCTV